MNREVCEHFVPTDQMCPKCMPCTQEPLLLYTQADLDAAVQKAVRERTKAIRRTLLINGCVDGLRVMDIGYPIEEDTP